ncbi:type I restriction endonuclease subunit R [Dermabacteraceae bacterium P13128]
MASVSSNRYDPIAISDASTVLAEYEHEPSTAGTYQSEAQLEQELIAMLQQQAYEYTQIRSGEELHANLRHQLEALNDVTFTDSEWDRLLRENISKPNDTVYDKTHRIQEDHIQPLEREDGSVKNIRLIDKQNIHNNRLQVINQYAVPGADGTRRGGNRYDVTILVNGLPLVHIELKRRGVDLKDAFNQIGRYSRGSFNIPGSLYGYVQLFVISNGTLTKYYSNTTRPGEGRGSGNYEFTSWWADARNKPIRDLRGFTKTFLAKHSLLNVITKYCVLTTAKELLVMRPYQIVATERILQKIVLATNAKKYSSPESGGYIWHTTGSGKTLTSFKTAQLASQMEGVDKVLFVVDRKDLDAQTIREYDRFQKGAANSNTSTAKLTEQLGDDNSRIIVTTIQKLARFTEKNKKHPVHDKHVVFVFDECHRSQFGRMHSAIMRNFKRAHLFGFTGTPILADNANKTSLKAQTTEQLFGKKLHSYLIVNAIEDKNVLPFKIDYVKVAAQQVCDEGGEKWPLSEQDLASEARLRKIVTYILDHFDQKTYRLKAASIEERRRKGFNAILATASIPAARKYHNLFAAVQEERVEAGDLAPSDKLRTAIIYSAGGDANPDGNLDDENVSLAGLDDNNRAFLEEAMQTYNSEYGTSYDTSPEGFEGYYRDVSKRLKDRELDLLIVVNMFLTGYDSKTVNTLFVDKNLRAHGLIQAYSRTNRIYNSVKSYGNIVNFRDLEEETDKALALYGNDEAASLVKLEPYSVHYAIYCKYVDELLEKYPLGKEIVGEGKKHDFVRLFGAILRMDNLLSAFDEHKGDQKLRPREMQDYRSVYLELYSELRGSEERTDSGGEDGEEVEDDLCFEIELVKQVEVNVDYILKLVQNRSDETGGDKEAVKADVERLINSSPALRDRRDLLNEFIDQLDTTRPVAEQWSEYIPAKRAAELEQLIKEENLRPDEAREYMGRAFRYGRLQTNGAEIVSLLPRMSRFSNKQEGTYGQRKNRIVGKLSSYFKKFKGLAGDEGTSEA